ncbi:MAG: CPBP family glutamic-type intramembrane protease [Candidatus Micrarchaeales archaeon]|jgi:membrane protease YdiL (CAAX protease family)|uniref:Abortive infection protein n=1 Tax=Candidatus Micrarchaeum acidiphilum ARMAN-2 TaxID=425595 RepID=C7DG49_MICA2|nr:MAG: Abortive infection protein [Candidatus Micrarchaeum acidiphilum ARMAN-2]MCW6161067.1 CPBP family glutamic-type intramembrane protease [Candidatus Micrarchaeales archaeon]
MKMKGFDYLLVFLPFLLWPITFIVLRSIFIYAMLASTFILAMLSLWKYRGMIRWKTGGPASLIAYGLAAAALLYLIFFLGYYVTLLMGLKGAVAYVYLLIYTQISNMPLLFVILAMIGVFEEIYWRGALQGFFERRSRIFADKPWLAAAIYYGGIHLTTLNIVLPVAALVIGIVTSIVAYKKGILSSMISHILWLESIIILLPVVHI